MLAARFAQMEVVGIQIDVALQQHMLVYFSLSIYGITCTIAQHHLVQLFLQDDNHVQDHM